MNDAGPKLKDSKPKPPRPAGPLKTIAEVAAFIGFSRWTVTTMLETGQLPGIILRAGRRKKIWRISEQALQKWIEMREQETRKMVQNGNRKLQAISR
jgi:excisionase family DNA binding protein